MLIISSVPVAWSDSDTGVGYPAAVEQADGTVLIQTGGNILESVASRSILSSRIFCRLIPAPMHRDLWVFQARAKVDGKLSCCTQPGSCSAPR